jgi:hypothetical protein
MQDGMARLITFAKRKADAGALRVAEFTFDGRPLVLRANVVGDTILVELFEGNRPLLLCAIIPAASAVDSTSGRDLVGDAMHAAQNDVMGEILQLPPVPSSRSVETDEKGLRWYAPLRWAHFLMPARRRGGPPDAKSRHRRD